MSVRVSGYYSVRFMERKEGGDKTEREKEGVGVGGRCCAEEMSANFTELHEVTS